ncbi:MAG: tetratricopeptide (TPR) repeat protein [Nitrospinales bacterium]|jgi:tetratricopeptide (TPR) repeat protein
MVVISFLLFFGVLFNPSPVLAQAHPGYGKFKLSDKDDAQILFARERYKESIEKFKEVLKSEGETSTAFRMMLKAWKAIEGLSDAEQFLKNYHASNKDSTHLWYAFGYLHYLKADYEKAENSFEKALKMNPENGLALNNLGAIFSEKKQYALAIEKVKSAIQTDPKKSMFFSNLQKIYQEMGEPDRFANEYKNLQQKNSEKLAWGYGKILVRVIRQRAFGSYSKGDLDNAILGFEDMLKIYQDIGDVNGQVPALFSLGLLNEEKGNIQKAQNYFAQVLALNPNHIQAKGKIKLLD